MILGIAIIIHDTLDETLPLNKDMWADLAAVFNVPHIYKVGGEQVKGLVQFGPEHNIPNKKVCVMTPREAKEAGVSCIELSDYIHKLESSYVFGPDNNKKGWQETFTESDTDCITIDTPSNTELYSFTAATLVLWHRWRFLNGSN